MLERKCVVTGFVLDSLGEPIAAGVLSLWPRSGRVELSVDTTALISNAPVNVPIGDDGAIEVELNPGAYYASIESAGRRTPRFDLGVPDTEAADFGDLLDGAAVPPPVLPRLPAGQPGQVVSYDADGNPVAIDAEAAAIRISPAPDNALTFAGDGGLYVHETISPDGGIDLTVLFDNQLV